MPDNVTINPVLSKTLCLLSKGKQPGTIVARYPIGEERQYMIEHYGGRLVAEGMSDSDINDILLMQNTILGIVSNVMTTNPALVMKVVGELISDK